VLAADGRLALGRPGRDGRGAWLCRDRLECFDAAARLGFARAWRAPVSGEALTALRAIMAGRATMEENARAPRAPLSGGRTGRT